MKIIAPARSKYMIKQMIEAGAEEIYLGLNEQQFQQLSFDDRFKTIAGYPAHVKNMDELLNMVEIAKQNKVKINFMANAPYIPKIYEDDYIQFVKKALEVGVDYLTISSIQALKLLKRSNLPLPHITAGSALAPTNIHMVRMLREMGFSRVTIPHTVTLEELKSWRAIGLEMITIGNFEKGSIPGSSRLWESPIHKEIGEGERTAYTVKTTSGKTIRSIPFIDSSTDCNLCSLGDLMGEGITSIKLIGREAPNPSTLASVVELYRQWIDLEKEGHSVAEKIEIMEQEHMMWIMRWTPRFCDKKRCTYLYTPTLQSYI
ncbi:peptidase U32 family protein [Chengkuizengella axinellae]|uniref:U32 family peptidase n=1 Tax=Chengkuizengella axinellae TaxID=3064388 RepID=A0ABT9IU21_9BACL|nr:U32 family peptidase [Chengkuizengella sp. 2205SS18-9]MDP5272825.1 U32 family peptidase [Chengkuizengella sp. 2205SS18-9]